MARLRFFIRARSALPGRRAERFLSLGLPMIGTSSLLDSVCVRTTAPEHETLRSFDSPPLIPAHVPRALDRPGAQFGQFVPAQPANQPVRELRQPPQNRVSLWAAQRHQCHPEHCYADAKLNHLASPFPPVG